MLFRAVAPVSSIKRVLRDIGPKQNGQALLDVFERILNPDSRQVLALKVDTPKFEDILRDTLATPAKVNNLRTVRSNYQDQEVIWLSSLESNDVFLSDAEFDLFIQEA